MVELGAEAADEAPGLAEVDNPRVGRQLAGDLDHHVVVVAVQRLAVAAEGREVGGGKAQRVAFDSYPVAHGLKDSGRAASLPASCVRTIYVMYGVDMEVGR